MFQISSENEPALHGRFQNREYNAAYPGIDYAKVSHIHTKASESVLAADRAIRPYALQEFVQYLFVVVMEPEEEGIELFDRGHNQRQ